MSVLIRSRWRKSQRRKSFDLLTGRPTNQPTNQPTKGLLFSFKTFCCFKLMLSSSGRRAKVASKVVVLCAKVSKSYPETFSYPRCRKMAPNGSVICCHHIGHLSARKWPRRRPRWPQCGLSQNIAPIDVCFRKRGRAFKKNNRLGWKKYTLELLVCLFGEKW